MRMCHGYGASVVEVETDPHNCRVSAVKALFTKTKEITLHAIFRPVNFHSAEPARLARSPDDDARRV